MSPLQDPNDLAWKLDCAAQGEWGPFDPDHDNGWTARLLREAAAEIIRLRTRAQSAQTAIDDCLSVEPMDQDRPKQSVTDSIDSPQPPLK